MNGVCVCGRFLIRGRCPVCNRSAFCRCEPAAVEREPLWITRSRQRAGGLSRDMSGVA